MGQKHGAANRRSVPRREIQPGAVVRLRDPGGRMCDGIVHHFNALHEAYILPHQALIEPFYANLADIEEVFASRRALSAREP